MTLPLLISLPHAGLRVPTEVESICALSRDELVRDGDEGAAAIYAIFDAVDEFVTTNIARAIVDVNRAEDDRRPDGVVKTHTCWEVPVYSEPPTNGLIELLLDKYYRPYHARLTELAGSGVRLAIDCHTMAANGPPIGPDPGAERPWVCVGNGEGTCPNEWVESMARRCEAAFDHPVSINDPFSGGYITQQHSTEMPWLQLEVSRASFMSDDDKRERIQDALTSWCKSMGWL